MTPYHVDAWLLAPSRHRRVDPFHSRLGEAIGCHDPFQGGVSNETLTTKLNGAWENVVTPKLAALSLCACSFLETGSGTEPHPWTEQE